MRAAMKSPLLVLALLDRLGYSAAWMLAVEQTREGEDPYELAKNWGAGPTRRAVIAALLLRASTGSLFAHAIPTDAPNGSSTYRYSARFWLSVLRGADCLVRYGDHACLACGSALRVSHWEKGGTSGRQERVLYCDSGTCHQEPSADRHALEAAFGHLAEALQVAR